MIAEVGDIEKVSGSKIAMPLAPPSPGQYADDDAEHDADHHQHHVVGLHDDGEAVEQIADILDHFRIPRAGAFRAQAELFF